MVVTYLPEVNPGRILDMDEEEKGGVYIGKMACSSWTGTLEMHFHNPWGARQHTQLAGGAPVLTKIHHPGLGI